MSKALALWVGLHPFGEVDIFLFSDVSRFSKPWFMNNQQDFQPKILPFKVSKTQLTSAAGLNTLIDAFDNSTLKDEFIKCLPERSSPRSQGSYRLGLIQLSSFMFGHDCIEDLERFRLDPMLEAIMKGQTVAARTMGDFLRDFEPEHLDRLNRFLSKQSRSYRRQLIRMLKKQFKPNEAPHLTIDSTAHVQRGKKMEGLAYNYKDLWCLDSQVIFDELGFCWDFELRAGNTKSGVRAADQIRRALSAYKFKDEKYLSADSAYCYQEVITTCLALGVKFTLTANQATTGWENHIAEITKWTPWVYTEEQIKIAQEAGVTLPEIELGRFYWQPSWNEGLRLPVVVKRTKAEQTTLLFGEHDYYGIVSNHSLHEWDLQKLMQHHNQRGNAENFIKEQKYGYDLLHFPCRELKANHAFGGLAMVAHNVLRWCSIHDNPSRPRFAKGLRNKFVHVPAKLVSHARQLVLRIPEHFLKEVEILREALGLKLCTSLSTAGP